MTNLLKYNTCFKGDGSCTDLILTNCKYSFKFSTTFETGLSDHHHFIYSYVSDNISERITLIYRDFKKIIILISKLNSSNSDHY